MKAAIFYILFLCFGLLAAHNHAHATAHNGKLSFAATDNTIHKQHVEADNFIDVEDENDDKDVTRKFTHVAKWLSVITCAFISSDPDIRPEKYHPHNRQHYQTGSGICIEQRILRI